MGFPQPIPDASAFTAVLTRSQGEDFRRALAAAERVARRERVGLVCAEDPYLSGWMAVELKRRLRLPLNVTIHYASLSLDMAPRSIRGQFWRRAAEWVLGQADSIRTVNAALARRLRRRYPKKPVYFIPLPVDLDAWSTRRRPSRRPTVLTIARLSPEKGLHLLLECLPALLRKHPDLEILIAGDGQLRPALEDAIEAMGVTRHVRLLGHQEPKQLRALVARASVFVLPSSSEGWGLATIEAMAAGVPVVVTNTGCAGVAVIDESTGLVVRRGDAAAFGRAIHRVLARPEWAASMGARGRELVRREFPAQTLVDQWMSCLEETMGMHRS